MAEFGGWFRRSTDLLQAVLGVRWVGRKVGIAQIGMR